MKILVAGSQGQLGTELMLRAGAHQLIGVDRSDLDITDKKAVLSLVSELRPDAVINAAAYTAVDRAEQEREAAFAVNRDGAAHLAEACARLNIPLVHVSTDYVFDGQKQEPYLETDAVNPLNVYGESKLAGEEKVRTICEKHLIFRTSWVFSAHGNNFVKTMLRLGQEREELTVVADQFGKPTWAGELARVILEILPASEGKWGLYHVAQPEAVSWHGFAEAIFREGWKQQVDLRVKVVKSIMSDDYPTMARRPKFSVMCCANFEGSFGLSIAPWDTSLNGVVCEIGRGSGSGGFKKGTFGRSMAMLGQGSSE